MSSMVMISVAVCALKDNPLHNTFVMLQRDLEDADYDELEKQAMVY